MKTKHIVLVAGTRPEIIKLWPVYQALQKRKGLRVTAVATGQHTSLADQTSGSLDFPFQRELNVMRPGQSLSSLLSRLIEALGIEFEKLRPDMIVVQGDTASALAGAIAGFHAGVRVAHVEAGLRTFDRTQPFPEEGYRVLTDQLSQIHFAPTTQSARNLIREGISKRFIFVTGNTVVDAVQAFLRESKPKKIWPKPYLLVTLHRRENFDGVIRGVSQALERVLRKHQDLHLIWPVHPNPNVGRQITKSLARNPRVQLVDPMSYIEFLHAAKGARLIVSDSGGVQEESPTVRTPVAIVRNVTERPEAVTSGWCYLAGTDTSNVEKAIETLLRRQPLKVRKNPFGDGRSGERIAGILTKHLRATPPHR